MLYWRGFVGAVSALRSRDYEAIIPLCTAEIESGGVFENEARLLRGTFRHLWNEPGAEYLEDLEKVAGSPTLDLGLRVSALIKKGSSLGERLGRKEEALKAFDAAETLSPDNPDVLFQRSCFLLQHGDDQDMSLAMESIKKTTELCPEYAPAGKDFFNCKSEKI